MVAMPRGMALLDGELFMISAWVSASRIMKYSCCTGNGTRKLLKVAPSYNKHHNPGMVHPYALATDTVKRHLYVAGQDTAEILRYDVASGDPRETPLPAPPALQRVAGLDPGVFAVFPGLACSEGEGVAGSNEGMKGGKGLPVTTKTRLPWGRNGTTPLKERNYADSGLRGIAVISEHRLLIALAKCDKNKDVGGKVYVIDLDTGEWLQQVRRPARVHNSGNGAS